MPPSSKWAFWAFAQPPNSLSIVTKVISGKFFDHLADALRYLCQAIREQHSPEAKATKTAEQEAAERLKAIAAHAFMSPDAEDENNYQ